MNLVDKLPKVNLLSMHRHNSFLSRESSILHHRFNHGPADGVLPFLLLRLPHRLSDLITLLTDTGFRHRISNAVATLFGLRLPDGPLSYYFPFFEHCFVNQAVSRYGLLLC